MRRVAVLTMLMMVALVWPLSQPASAEPVSDEAAFVAKINDLRASKGLGTLTVHGELVAIARNWSQQMASVGDISHNPNFKNQVTANWARLGENVGMGPSVDSLFAAFVASPAHYANLVEPVYTHIGVGVVYAGSTIFTSHQFMTLRGGAAPAPAAPRVTAPPTTRTTRVTVARPPAAPAPVTTTTTAPPPPPPPPPPPVVPDRVRQVMELLRGFDPVA